VRSSPFAAAGILLLVTGCLGYLPGSQPVQKTQTNGTVDPGVTAISPDLPKPGNRSGNYSAFEETNMTDMIGMHSHDYWAGRTKVVVQDLDVRFPYDTGPFQLDIKPKRGLLIYEGTDHVEVAVTNPARSLFLRGIPAQPLPVPPGTLNLSFLSAASGPGQWGDAGKITFGTPVEIPIKAEQMTDMPHSTGSLWDFRIFSADPQSAGLSFHVTITIYRGAGAIPEWPSHPLFYATTHYRTVFDGNGKVQDQPVTNDFLGGAQPVIPEGTPGRLISEGTASVLVFVNITSLQSATGIPPTHLWLLFHNASYDVWNNTSPFDNNHSLKSQNQLFRIRVDPNGMDSPYQDASRWQFVVRAATTTPLISCIRQCNPYTMTYHLTVIATDLKLASYDATEGVYNQP
jgi:hypothetical protein